MIKLIISSPYLQQYMWCLDSYVLEFICSCYHFNKTKLKLTCGGYIYSFHKWGKQMIINSMFLNDQMKYPDTFNHSICCMFKLCLTDYIKYKQNNLIIAKQYKNFTSYLYNFTKSIFYRNRFVPFFRY